MRVASKFLITATVFVLSTLGANAATNSAAQVPDRFDHIIQQDSDISIGEFANHTSTVINASAVAGSNDTDYYSYRLLGGVSGGTSMRPLSMTPSNPYRITFSRNRVTEQIGIEDGASPTIEQVNGLLAALPKRNQGEGEWSARVPLFGDPATPTTHPNPTVHFEVREKRMRGLPVWAGTYVSEPYRVVLPSGDVVTGHFKGFAVSSNDWQVPIASGFVFEGKIKLEDGTFQPVSVRNLSSTLHKHSGEQPFANDGLFPVEFMEDFYTPLEASYQDSTAGIVPKELPQLILVTSHAEALTVAFMEGRSNPFPLWALAGLYLTAEAVVVPLLNVGIDVSEMAFGDRNWGDFENPFDHEAGNHIQAPSDYLTDKIGDHVIESGLVAINVDPETANLWGQAVNNVSDVALGFIAPSKGLGKIANILWGKSGQAGAAQDLYRDAGYVAHYLGLSVNKASRPAQISQAISKMIGTVDDYLDKFEAGRAVASLILDYTGSGPLTSKFTRDNDFLDKFASDQKFRDQFIYAIYADAQSSLFQVGSFVNSVPVFSPSSTGGFADAAIILPLRFTLRDHQQEDGDIVILEVRSLNGININNRQVALLNAPQLFEPRVAAGPVEIRITALNQGSLGPNTGEVSILSNVLSGPSIQQFNLSTGDTGVLRIIAGN